MSVEKIILLSQKANISADYILMGKTSIIDENYIKNLVGINQNQLEASFNILQQILLLLKKKF